ncbi:TlpA family protein disulfide reductase [Cellulophaga baltica]|uniref:TlpA family protein disulfide reductase n=1 Tax=Cellulophaga TaxID=104264 RepID=UPI001C0751DB|nr:MULTISPECIES: TlpA disulfide reductase family protein [Cellulophaga]MBU2997770.1 TlpA family protein disulfide reductase [Cellulophaga baltica]MDO6769166.1 TlpA disulfide reductase family protein [Cellulophaga sp. 1_MG-2023]
MKKILFVLITLVTLNINAQHTISGTFSPAEDFTWLIAYRLKEGTQVYVADSKIDKGSFSLTIPENKEPGTYRIVYAVPQEEYNFDIIYNGKEDIVFNFNVDNGASFKKSEENIVLNTYLSELASTEKEIIDFYNSNDRLNKSKFNKITAKLTAVQKNYEEKSKGLMAHNFITSNKPYIPTQLETVQDYVAHKKENYFNALDFSNSVLKSSNFLTDKSTNYVFSALPLKEVTKGEKEQIIIENVKTLDKYVDTTAANFKFQLYNNLWNYAVAYGYNDVSDYIYNATLKDLAVKTENIEIKAAIEAHNRLRLGEIAPEITWKSDKIAKKLSTLEGATNYVLIFWSSTCGHCLKELPALHKELKDKSGIKVVAVGLEDGTDTWDTAIAKLTAFEHAISLGKWDSTYAALYDIHATPTYYVLDKDKKIIAKPEDDKAVVEFLDKIY